MNDKMQLWPRPETTTSQNRHGPTFSAFLFLHLVAIFLLPYDQPAIGAHLEAMILLLALARPGLCGWYGVWYEEAEGQS
jgi:hypothetical protein